jgi:hypothetical protein
MNLTLDMNLFKGSKPLYPKNTEVIVQYVEAIERGRPAAEKLLSKLNEVK